MVTNRLSKSRAVWDDALTGKSDCDARFMANDNRSGADQFGLLASDRLSQCLRCFFGFSME